MSIEKKDWSWQKKLLLVATSIILLSGCDKKIPLERTDCSELILAVTQDKEGITALGINHLFLVTGKHKKVVGGKLMTLPAGSAIGLYSGKLTVFLITDLITKHGKQFPILVSKPVNDSAVDQAKQLVKSMAADMNQVARKLNQCF